MKSTRSQGREICYEKEEKEDTWKNCEERGKKINNLYLSDIR